jgi:ParB family chromosome partitioning protein
LPASLIESLTAHRSAALNVALLEPPDVAFAATVHALVWQVFYSGLRVRGDSVLQVTANAASLHQVEESRASEIIGAAGDIRIAKRVPVNSADLFPWCLAQQQDMLMDMLAFCVAQTVNAVQLKTNRPDSTRFEHASRLADALQLDMAAWFTPTAANYFSRVSKTEIVETIREVKGAIVTSSSGMKKADLASLAEREIAGTGWLSAPRRAPAASTAQGGGG